MEGRVHVRQLDERDARAPDVRLQPGGSAWNKVYRTRYIEHSTITSEYYYRQLYYTEFLFPFSPQNDYFTVCLHSPPLFPRVCKPTNLPSHHVAVHVCIYVYVHKGKWVGIYCTLANLLVIGGVLVCLTHHHLGSHPGNTSEVGS